MSIATAWELQLEVWIEVIFVVRSGRKKCGVIRSGLSECQYINEEEGVEEGRGRKRGGGVFGVVSNFGTDDGRRSK